MLPPLPAPGIPSGSDWVNGSVDAVGELADVAEREDLGRGVDLVEAVLERDRAPAVPAPDLRHHGAQAVGEFRGQALRDVRQEPTGELRDRAGHRDVGLHLHGRRAVARFQPGRDGRARGALPLGLHPLGDELDAMRGVVRKVLSDVAANGELPGDEHRHRLRLWRQAHRPAPGLSPGDCHAGPARGLP